MNKEVSPHPHVVTDVGCVDQTFHHSADGEHQVRAGTDQQGDPAPAREDPAARPGRRPDARRRRHRWRPRFRRRGPRPSRGHLHPWVSDAPPTGSPPGPARRSSGRADVSASRRTGSPQEATTAQTATIHQAWRIGYSVIRCTVDRIHGSMAPGPVTSAAPTATSPTASADHAQTSLPTPTRRRTAGSAIPPTTDSGRASTRTWR